MLQVWWLLGASRHTCLQSVSNKLQQRDKLFFSYMLLQSVHPLFSGVNMILLIISEDVLLEDLEDGVRMKNQWLIRTPRKSFYVSAASYEEKRAWMEHIEQCKDRVLQSGGRRSSLDFASTWIPDQASAICMRCASKFTKTLRRHHCRKCGFLVCGPCSRKRALITHIDSAKQLRVCRTCYFSLGAGVQDSARQRWDSAGKSDEDELDECSEEEEAELVVEEEDPSRWMESCSLYIYIKPEHIRPQT